MKVNGDAARAAKELELCLNALCVKLIDADDDEKASFCDAESHVRDALNSLERIEAVVEVALPARGWMMDPRQQPVEIVKDRGDSPE